MLLFSGWVGQAWAVCSLGGGTAPAEIKFSSLPASVTLQSAAVGGVLAYYDVRFTRSLPWYRCQRGDFMAMEAMTVSLPLLDASKGIYESGVVGIGIRFGFLGEGWGNTPWVPPFNKEIAYALDIPFNPPNVLRVEFIRTGMEVGSGSITPFDLRSAFMLTPATPAIRFPISTTQLKTTLVNNIYFTSCYNPASAPTVNLGRPAISELRQGNTLQKDFSLDIRCDGMNPTTKPPVSIYFEGNSPRDGLLLTDGQGQAGMAQGVGVTLTNDKGVALPFSKANAMPMTWTSSGTNSEFYHFAGKARYIASGGEIKAGKADATLTYVLQYN
ncbi:fimbrial protein [Burkholderia ubonensis]|uniref:fimbrial protein n=1 Tax=Burkholderia ubonensis TaxID=101571 RepID=UPI00358EF44B